MTLLHGPLHAKLPQLRRSPLLLLGRQLFRIQLIIAAQVFRLGAACRAGRQAGFHAQQGIAHLRHFVDNQLEPASQADFADFKLGQQLFRRDNIERIPVARGDVRLAGQVELVGSLDRQKQLIAWLDIEARLFGPLITEVDLVLDGAALSQAERSVVGVTPVIDLDVAPRVLNCIIVTDFAADRHDHIGRDRTADSFERHFDLWRLVFDRRQEHTKRPLRGHLVGVQK